MQVAEDNRNIHHRSAMTSLPAEEPHSALGVKLRIKYNRTTIIVLSSILRINNVMHCLVEVAFLGHPVIIQRGIKHKERNRKHSI